MATLNVLSITYTPMVFTMDGNDYPIIIGECTLDSVPQNNDSVIFTAAQRIAFCDYINTGILTPCGIVMRGYGKTELLDTFSAFQKNDDKGLIGIDATKTTYQYTVYIRDKNQSQILTTFASSWGWSSNHMSLGVGALFYEKDTGYILSYTSSFISSINHTTTSTNYNPDGVINLNGIPVTAHITTETTESSQTATVRSSITWNDIKDAFKSSIQTGDPYTDGGTSEQEGGTGDFDGTSDEIDFPAVPTLSASSTGFIKLFNPSIAQLNSLAAFMWSNPLFDISAWKKIFADPMDAILGLSLVPVAVPNGGTATVTVGNIPTDVSMTIAASQYVELDCGTLNVNEYWGAYLDYDPYTRAEIYLPYIGIKPISVDDIMGKAVAIKYHVDILSGACVAYIKCGDSVLYSYIGQCASSIPITGNDWTNVINGVMSIAGAIGTTVATGGATAPMALGTTASTMVNQMKPNIQKSGGMSGTGGMLAIQKPYMILTRPRQALPENQNTFMGYPSFITLSLADVSGYTEIESIHLENMTGTGAEIAEIESILKTGVIL